jgi:hypothetical protein
LNFPVMPSWPWLAVAAIGILIAGLVIATLFSGDGPAPEPKPAADSFRRSTAFDPVVNTGIIEFRSQIGTT